MNDIEIKDKLMSPEEVVRRFIKNGMQIAIGGFTVNRNPMGLIYEIVRQGIKDLHLVCHSNGQGLDILVGAGCVRRIEIAYAGNGRFAPTCIRFRKAVEEGKILLEDYSNYQMSLRFLAGSLGIPFIPTKSGLETDLLKRKGFPPEVRKERKVAREKFFKIQNPFNGKEDPVVLLPALNPDVALLHSQYVGEDGTVRMKGLTFADIEQAKSADVVIVSCEEILPREFIRRDPDQNSLPPFLIDGIVKLPYGAHPTACFYFYDYDVTHLNLYKEAAKDNQHFRQYLDEWVYGVSKHEEYLEKVGLANLTKIKANPMMGYAPGLDRRYGETEMTRYSARYSDREMMAISAGRLIKNGDILFAGTGGSMLAAMVAKRIHAPKSVVFFETGGIDPLLIELPMAVADPRVMYGTCLNSGLIEAFSIVGHRKLHTIAFLGAAQIDKFGNLNSTCIGDYAKPRIRFPGSGGACDAASLAYGFIVFMQHEKKKFVEKLDYLTSPGWLDGGDSRSEAGLPRGGPLAVVTNLGVMKFDDKTKAMYLSEYYPGITLDRISENTGFEMNLSMATEAIPPTDEELMILRNEVDPQRLILG